MILSVQPLQQGEVAWQKSTLEGSGFRSVVLSLRSFYHSARSIIPFVLSLRSFNRSAELSLSTHSIRWSIQCLSRFERVRRRRTIERLERFERLISIEHAAKTSSHSLPSAPCLSNSKFAIRNPKFFSVICRLSSVFRPQARLRPFRLRSTCQNLKICSVNSLQ